MPANSSTLPRTCADCGIGIPHRSIRTERCAGCAKAHKYRQHTEWYRRTRSTWTGLCEDCGIDISDRHRTSRLCLECVAARRRERERTKYHADEEWRLARNAHNREYHYTRRRSDPEWAEQVRATNRARNHALYHGDPEWRAKENTRRVVAKKVQYHTDPEYRARHNNAVRLRKPWDDTVTSASVAALLAAQRNRCPVCDVDIANTYALDHILPLAQGGASTLANLQLLCGRCNSAKGARLGYFAPNGGQGWLALGV